MPKYYGCPCEAAASPSHFRMTSWSAPTAARLITASATRSWASASTAPPTPPAASGSSPTRRANSAPVRPAASAPCGMRKPAAAAVLCFPPRGRSLLLPAAAAKRLSTTPDVPSVRHFRRPGEGVFLRTPSAKRPRWMASPVRTGWTISPRPPRLPRRLQPDAAPEEQGIHELFGPALRPFYFFYRKAWKPAFGFLAAELLLAAPTFIEMLQLSGSASPPP